MKKIFENSKINNSLGALIVSVLALTSCGGGGGGGAYTTTTVAIKSTTVAPGDTHTCASLPEGTVKCWGDNSYGQLGTDWILPRVYNPITVSGITNAQALTSGSSYTCALLQDNTVSCWGSNISGQLGDGTTNDSFTLVKVSGLTNVTAVSASHGRLDNYGHTCALLSDTTVKCWGRNIVGQLGTGTITDSTTPVAVSGLSGVAAISAGGWHTMALKSDGTLWGWGYNGSGRLGDGTTNSRYIPGQIGTDTDWMTIAPGGWHTVALKFNGTLWAWGDNTYGQSGDGTTTNNYFPMLIPYP